MPPEPSWFGLPTPISAFGVQFRVPCGDARCAAGSRPPTARMKVTAPARDFTRVVDFGSGTAGSLALREGWIHALVAQKSYCVHTARFHRGVLPPKVAEFFDLFRQPELQRLIQGVTK